jgi:hypothetical protein
MNGFESVTKPLTWFMALLLVAFVAGCGDAGRDPILGGPGVTGAGGAGGAGGSPGPAGAGPDLGAAAAFGGFGGNAGMTNAGISTIITGAAGQPVSVGTTAASQLMTGFHDNSVPYAPPLGCIYTETLLNVGAVNGTIITAAGTSQPTASCPNEANGITAGIALAAFNAANLAFIDLRDRPGGLDVSVCPGCGGGLPGELGGRTLAPGIYKSAVGSYDITTGNLTLDPGGNADAVWVFQMPASTLTVGGPGLPRSVILIPPAQPKNVFWQVGSAATITPGGGTMVGTIISVAGATIGTNAASPVTILNGRALSLVASVVLNNTVINVPAP